MRDGMGAEEEDQPENEDQHFRTPRACKTASGVALTHPRHAGKALENAQLEGAQADA